MKTLSILAISVLFAAAAAASVGDGDNVSLVGRDGDGPSEAVAYTDDLILHGRGSLLEILDRTTLARRGMVVLGGAVADITCRDDLAYVAAGRGGLRIVSVADPAHPVELGHLDGLGYPYALALAGDLVLMVHAADGMAVIDAASPAAPRLLASVPIAGGAADIAARGAQAIVAEGPDGLEVFDLGDPARPVSLFVAGTVGDAWGLAVFGDQVFTAEPAGLSVYDLTGTGIEHVATLGLSPYPTSLSIVGDILLATSYGFGFHLVDISDPGAMSPYSYTPSTDRVFGAAFDGRFAYLAASVAGLRTIDAADPAHPLAVGTVATPGSACQVAVAGDLAAFASAAAGLRLIDLADPAGPVDLGTWRDGRQMDDVDLVGHLAYVSQGTAGIGVVDVSDPASPVEVGRFAPAGFPVRSFAIAGSLGYAATAYAPCLRVLDLAAPQSPVEVAALDMDANVAQVAVADDRAYLAAGNQGLLVVDIGDPQGPDLLQRLPMHGDATLVGVAGGHAFVIRTVFQDYIHDSWLRIYDLTGHQVAFVTELALDTWVHTLAVELPYVYLGADGAVRVIDVSTPSAPAEVGNFEVATTPQGLFARDRGIVVGDDTAGIWTLHNDHAEVAVELSGLSARREADGVRLSWATTAPLGIATYAIWRQEDGAARVVAGSLAGRDPATYDFLDTQAPAAACSYLIEGRRLDQGSVWFGPATAPALTGGAAWLRCWPNPVRASATFAFALSSPSTVHLDVYDLRGRRVADVERGEFRAGLHQIVWDRRDDLGRPVAAGTYLARLSGADVVRTVKVLVED